MIERLRNVNWKFIFNNKGQWDWLGPALGGAGALIGGLFGGDDEPQYMEPQAPLFTPYPTYEGHEDLIKRLYGYMGERMEQPYGMPEDVSQAIWGRARKRAIPGIREAYATRGRAGGGQAIQAEGTAEREMAIDRAIAEAEWARQSGTQRFGEMMSMANLYPQYAMTQGQYMNQPQSQLPGFLQQMGAAMPYMGGQQTTTPWSPQSMPSQMMPYQSMGGYQPLTIQDAYGPGGGTGSTWNPSSLYSSGGRPAGSSSMNLPWQ